MLPALLTIGPFKVYLFGIFLALAFLISTFVIFIYGKEELKEEEYLDCYLFTSIVVLLSARIVYIMLNFNQFGLNILRFVLVRETPGLSLFGGLIGGFIFLVWYTKKRNLSLFHTLDLVSIAFSFALVLAKIGEFVGGAGFGKETNFFLRINIIGSSVKHHPVELYEALFFLLLSIILVVINRISSRKKWPNGLIFYLFIIGFGLITFLLEFLKGYQVYLYGISMKQVGILVLLSVVIIPLYKRFKFIRMINLKKK